MKNRYAYRMVGIDRGGPENRQAKTHREERQPQEDARLVLLRRDRGRRAPVPHISETSIPQRPPNKRRLIRQSVTTP